MELKIEYLNVNDLEEYSGNARKHQAIDIEAIMKSIKEFGFSDPIGIWSDHNVIVEGHGRLEAAKRLGMSEVPCIRLDHMTDEQRRAYGLAHNKVAELSSWDFDALDEELAGITEIDMNEFGFADLDRINEDDEIERKKKEFEERIAAGEIDEGDEEYQEFLQKFEIKKTTDDCYTPEKVYEAVATWVEKKYAIKRVDMIRPFYPGGDYQREKYPKGCVVVDNPPFSILSEILKFYNANKISFFLFAPALTLFSSSSSSSSTAICTGAAVIYENNASVCTSFLTNLEDRRIRLKSEPVLRELIDNAVAETLKERRKQIPKYSYPLNIVTSQMVSQYSKYGIDFEVSVEESIPISQLDSQKESGKSIYGKGYIINSKKKAEREKAEREKVERWELSKRELDLIKSLDENATILELKE